MVCVRASSVSVFVRAGSGNGLEGGRYRTWHLPLTQTPTFPSSSHLSAKLGSGLHSKSVSGLQPSHAPHWLLHACRADRVHSAPWPQCVVLHNIKRYQVHIISAHISCVQALPGAASCSVRDSEGFEAYSPGTCPSHKCQASHPAGTCRSGRGRVYIQSQSRGCSSRMPHTGSCRPAPHTVCLSGVHSHGSIT
jgi:hypothetical protein